MTKEKETNVLRITESALMLAFATVLSMVKLFEMPMGGTITAFSMLPIAIIAYRYGVKWGLLTGAAFGLLQMLLGMQNLRYGVTLLAIVCIILFDYIAAFTVLGFGGAFRGKFNNQGLELSLGILLSCIFRYICHFITGCTIWSMWAPEGTPAYLYSLGYNASYMIPETAMTMIAAVLICAFLNFQSRDITKKSDKQEESVSIKPFLLKLVGIIILLFGIIYNVSIYVYSLSKKDYEMPSFELRIIIFAACAVMGAIMIIISKKIGEKESKIIS